MSIILIGPENGKDIIVLKHPRTSQPTQFLVAADHSLYEIIALTQPHKQSLFHGDFIVSDAPIHIATPFDATFLLIAQLSAMTQADQFIESSEMLDSFPARLRTMLQPLLVNICDALDVTGDGSEPYYRLSKARMQSFIQARITRVQGALPRSIVDKLPSHEEIAIIARQKAALELVSSYLSPALAADIAGLYDFSKLTAHMESVKSEYVNPNEFIKRKNEDEESMTTALVKKAKKGSKGVESLKKVNTKGMKSMTSFFTKKAKAS